MSTNKKNKNKIIKESAQPVNTGPIERPIIIVDNQQIPVSTPTARMYYRYHNTLYFDKIITSFLIIGVIGFLSAYIYYCFDNNRLLHKASHTCPTFYCPSNQNIKDPPCGGKGFHVEPSGKKICTV
jgi:hypothetical protein